MQILLILFGVLPGLLLGVLLVALLVPLRLGGRAVFQEHLVDASADASWGFGLLRVDVGPDDGVVLRLLRRPVYRYPGRRRRSRQLEGRLEDVPAERQVRHRGAPGRRPGPGLVWRVARRVLRSLRLRAWVNGRLGARDPADTAKVFGLLVASRALLPGLDTTGIRIEWMEPALDLDGRVQARVWPAAIVWIALTEYGRSRWERETG